MLLGACLESGGSPGLWCHRLSKGFEEVLGVYLSTFFEGPFDFACGRDAPSADDRFLLHGSALDTAVSVLGDFWKENRDGVANDPMLTAWARASGHTVTRTRQQLILDKEWYKSNAYQNYFRRASLGDTMLARFPSGGGKWMLLNLWREAGERPFTERERQFVHLLAAELASLLEQGRLAPLAGLERPLSPRVAEVLALLRDGLSEKVIAYELGISKHTVHNHVKRLHTIFGAGSRSQLLARTQHILTAGDSIRFGPLVAPRSPQYRPNHTR